MNNTKPAWTSCTTEPGTSGHPLIKSENDFIEHKPIEGLKKLISGKKVCVIGPAPSLLGSNLGGKIDSYDIVVRINQKFQMSLSEQIDYGKRCDILMGSFNENNIQECYDNLEHTLKQKMIIGVMPNKGYKPIDDFKIFLESKNIEHYFLDDRYIYKVFRDVGTVVNSGLISIILLMNYDIKEIFVAGFTFYNMGEFGKIYRDDYFNSIVKSGGYNISKQDRYQERNDFKIHDIQSQITFFSKYVQEHKERIKLDDYLKENIPR
jgi:hypothetical protein